MFVCLSIQMSDPRNGGYNEDDDDVTPQCISECIYKVFEYYKLMKCDYEFVNFLK